MRHRDRLSRVLGAVLLSSCVTWPHAEHACRRVTAEACVVGDGEWQDVLSNQAGVPQRVTIRSVDAHPRVSQVRVRTVRIVKTDEPCLAGEISFVPRNARYVMNLPMGCKVQVMLPSGELARFDISVDEARQSIPQPEDSTHGRA